MGARATWKGFLKISLVNIPIKVFPATESSGTISFSQLHGECRTRIQQKRWCPHCNREVPHSEIVKGYEFEKGRYVVMEDQDFDKVRPESTRVIDLVQFADDSAIDPMYVDRTYYLAPDGGIAADAIVAPTVEAPPRVVNLMDALKKSLDAVSSAKKRPAKVVAKPGVMRPAATAKRKRA